MVLGQQNTLFGYRIGGYKRDNEDPRDNKFQDLVPKFGVVNTPDIFDLREYCADVEDQKTTSSCTVNATVGGLEVLENVQSNNTSCVTLSRLFIYYNARLENNDQDKDEGTYIRNCMSALAGLGVCEESVWPFDVDKVNDKPSWASYRGAVVHKTKGFYRIDGNGQGRVEQIEKSISAKHPVVFGATLSQNFGEPDSNNMVHAPSGSVVGGHAMLLVGFDRKNRIFTIRNSWGKDWFDGGYCYASYDWLDQCDVSDVWVQTLFS